MGGELRGVRIAGPVWPPKPLDPDMPTFFICKAAGSRKVEYETCTGICSAAGRLPACKGCFCPWRVCPACVLQHAAAEDMRQLDPETELCPFHTEHGPHAKRPEAEDGKDSIRLRLVPRAPMVPKDEEPTENEVRPVPTEKELVLVVLPNENELRSLGRDMRTALNPFRLSIVHELAEGVSREEIARKLRTTTNNISVTVHACAKALGLKRPPTCSASRIRYFEQVLAAAYRFLPP